LYGFSFESPRGIFVDNLAFRGISGIELKRISLGMLDAINQVHPYDLIILQYGPNLLFKPELTDFDWYEKPMSHVLQNLKTFNPTASILVIGSADKSCRYDGDYQTQKGVLPLIAIQHAFAMQEEVNFWNLFNAMGGKNSMMKWVKMKPPLANVDYTHLTHKGARTIAKSLFDQIMLVYDPQAASRSQIQPIVRYVSASRNM
jgi:lysophospholipase L1-like esterase